MRLEYQITTQAGHVSRMTTRGWRNHPPISDSSSVRFVRCKDTAQSRTSLQPSTHESLQSQASLRLVHHVSIPRQTRYGHLKSHGGLRHTGASGEATRRTSKVTSIRSLPPGICQQNSLEWSEAHKLRARGGAAVATVRPRSLMRAAFPARMSDVRRSTVAGRFLTLRVLMGAI